MKFNLFMLPTIPATDEERVAKRPIGRNTAGYQEMLAQVRELTQMAEDVGFDSIGITEHHFHSEGYEVSVAPLLLMADLAARTERIKFLTLGLVAPAWDPIRLAEETAILDQLTQGRYYAGFARGYQDRWVKVLGQKYQTEGALSDGSAADLRNREIYEEVVDIVRHAWQDELLTYDGQFYKVPYPDGGIKNWKAADFTRRFGAPGEVDADGTVKAISVVPRPYQEPHPPMFQPFSVSESTIRYTAEKGIVPYVITSYPEEFARLCRVYQEVSAENGRDLGLGQGVGALRSIHFGDSVGEAQALMEATQLKGWNEWFGAFGYWEAFRLPEDNEKYPLGEVPLPESEWTAERFRKHQYSLLGTPDDVKREFEALARVHGDGNLEWFSWFFDQGVLSMDDARRQLELFGKHIIGEFV
jgi:alkanesulfonate monooxygenase SsuD/methylene tetrahydromethanopterin reductase-like flavin-dependent oxidoreductase (luciferase family)